MSSTNLLRFIVGAGPGDSVGIAPEGVPAQTDPPAPEGAAGGDPAPEPKEVDGPKLNQYGYPDGVPLTEMTAEQQTAYWKRMSRKHEQRADESVPADEAQQLRDRIAELESATMSAEQVAVQQQLDTAREEGRTAAISELMPIIHESQLTGYGSTVITGERLHAWVASANPAHFLGEDGAIDGEKVRTHLISLFGEKEPESSAPKQKYPNFGQSAPIGGGARPQRGTNGLEEARKRFGSTA